MKFETGISEENIIQNKLSELKLKEMLQPKSPIDDKVLGYLAAAERLEFAKNKEKQDQEEFQQNLELRKQNIELSKKNKTTDILQKLDKTTQSQRSVLQAFNNLNEAIDPNFDIMNADFDIKNNKIFSNGKEIDPAGITILGKQVSPGSEANWIDAKIQELSNLKVYDASGKAINETEMERLKKGMAQGTFNNEASKYKALQDYAKSVKMKMIDSIKTAPPEVADVYKQRMEQEYPELFELGKSNKNKQLSDRDKQALEWAEANPDKPQAAKIKAKLGL